MSIVIEINKKKYNIEKNEFVKIPTIDKYCNLIIRKNVGYYERFASLFIELLKINKNCNSLIYISPTHGGFVPIECSKHFKHIYILNCLEEHKTNILKNIEIHNVTNISFINHLDEITKTEIQTTITNQYIIMNEYEDFKIQDNFDFKFCENSIIINNNQRYKYQNLNYHLMYSLDNTNFIVHIPFSLKENFINEFKYFFNDNFVDESNSFIYDNLINLCVIVKNGGDDFKNMLIQNLPIIDRWTILDTGSTDNTIENIKEILVGKKKGELFEEPFVDFKTSRNKCIDLAGDTCKFILMLDDTYIIKNKGRQFVNFVRDDQYSDSFSFFIKDDDVEYTSNRLIKTDRKHIRYLFKIHEVITPINNINVIIPIDDTFIEDTKSDYMNNRTINRKQMDLKLLFDEIRDDPDNPRHYYYVAQTYNCIGDYEKTLEYFLLRYHHPDPNKISFLQEKHDAIFEAGRTANFKLNRDWEESKKYYEWAYETDNGRPESLYFLGMHYYLQNTLEDKQIAFEYLKKAYKIGYPIDKQYSLKPTLSFYFLPKFLSELSYLFEDYHLGLDVCKYFFQNNKTSDIHSQMISWYSIFEKLSFLPPKPKQIFYYNKPIVCFVADGGWDKWSGKDILTKGVGGSETYIIEMARYIQKFGYFNVFVFCNCETNEIFEDVNYLHLSDYYSFIQNNYVDISIISRYTDYIPVTIQSNVKNIFVVFHDLIQSIIVPNDNKIKHFFCLSEWHVQHFNEILPDYKNLTSHLYYGIDQSKFIMNDNDEIIPYKFIYSSFPNRGLLQLLELWPLIFKKYPSATLYIYCDVDGKWVNDIAPEDMIKCRQLIKLYNKININYCGWVDKTTLAQSWITADVWFYPCTFTETFCLTALEAALTKTLVITTDLGALQNTVSDRGVIIKGNPKTDEWKKEALITLFNVLDNPTLKHSLIEKNYQWGKKLSWESQANLLQNKLIQYSILNKDIDYNDKYQKNNDYYQNNINDKDNYNINYNNNINDNNNNDYNEINKSEDNIKINFINDIEVFRESQIQEEEDDFQFIKLSNKTQFLETLLPTNFPKTELNYFNMYNWTHDLPHDKSELQIFLKNLNYFNSKKIPRPKILEIGVYTGTSLIHIVDYIPNSYGIGIDNWKNYNEFNPLLKTIENNNIKQIFYENINKANLKHRIEGRQGESIDILTQMLINGEMFDLIYIDASHYSFDCYSDLTLSFKLLKKNGLLIIDDFLFNYKKNMTFTEVLNTPHYAIQYFYKKYHKQIKLLDNSYRVFFEKK